MGRTLVCAPPPFPQSEHEIVVDASVDKLATGVGRNVMEMMDLLWHAYGWPFGKAVDKDGNWRGL